MVESKIVAQGMEGGRTGLKRVSSRACGCAGEHRVGTNVCADIHKNVVLSEIVNEEAHVFPQ
jgi:hypothetical protein